MLPLACGRGSGALAAAGPLDAGLMDAGREDAGPVDAGTSVALLPSSTWFLTLDAGAFPPSSSHPSAVVYIPSGFDPTPQLAVVVYIHGFDNCVSNIILDAGGSCDAAGGTPVRYSYGLVRQFEESGKNAILLCPEVAFDQATGNPGTLGQPLGFLALLNEALAQLEPVLGTRSAADVGQLQVFSHSGGYEAAAGIARVGGVPVEEIDLLDSLYGNVQDYEDWILSDIGSFDGPLRQRRFADVYTLSAGTLSNSQALADTAATWVPDAGILLDDRVADTWTDPDYDHGLLFKFSGLTHDGVPAYYFGELVRTGQLPARTP